MLFLLNRLLLLFLGPLTWFFRSYKDLLSRILKFFLAAITSVTRISELADLSCESLFLIFVRDLLLLLPYLDGFDRISRVYAIGHKEPPSL